MEWSCAFWEAFNEFLVEVQESDEPLRFTEILWCRTAFTLVKCFGIKISHITGQMYWTSDLDDSHFFMFQPNIVLAQDLENSSDFMLMIHSLIYILQQSIGLHFCVIHYTTKKYVVNEALEVSWGASGSKWYHEWGNFICSGYEFASISSLRLIFECYKCINWCIFQHKASYQWILILIIQCV